MILIDTNALIILTIGLIDRRLIGKHPRTSVYNPEDFDNLISFIGNLENLIVLPNILTEVDDLLNNFGGNHKWDYLTKFKEIMSLSTERYMQSLLVSRCDYFDYIGLTDSAIIEIGKQCKCIITADSKLSDYARSEGIQVYDMVIIANSRL